MKLKELSDWAQEGLSKNNHAIMEQGVAEKEVHKVRSYLRMIIDKCTKIIANTTQNDNYLKDIQEYLNYLSKMKLNIPSDKKDGNEQKKG